MIYIDSWPYDLMLSGELGANGSVTPFPVEDGSETGDNIVHDPKTLTLEALVSDTPIGDIASHPSRVVDEVSQTVFNGESPLPSAEAYDRLLAIRDEKRRVTVELPVAARGPTPGRRTYPNMVIVALSLPLGRESDGGLRFTVTFQPFEFVRNARATIVRTATPAGRGPRNVVTVGKAWVIDRTLKWTYSYFGPGGYVDDTSPWTLLNVIDNPDGKTSSYYYGGDSSQNYGGRQFPFDDTPRRPVEGAEKERLFADTKRDYTKRQRERRRANQTPAQNQLEDTLDNISARYGGPPLVDDSRIKDPEPLVGRYRVIRPGEK